MSDWFESWFDTPYYHILYKNRDVDEARKFVRELAENLDIKKESYILDLCCGKGRHAIQLNDLGYKVHGVDLSKESIEFAKSFENESLTFAKQDMRDHINKGPFDVVFNLFTSFGYFNNRTENEKVLRSVSGYLKKDGFFVIDFLNASKISSQLPQEEVILSDQIEFNVKKLIQNQIITKEIKFRDQGKDYCFFERVQAFSLQDFKDMFANTGFELIGVLR